MFNFRKILPYFVSFLIPFIGFLNYTLNHFYVQGAYFLDSGWFAFLSRDIDHRLTNPQALGGVYLSTHFSPIFHVIGAFGSVFPDHGAVIFSLFLGLSAGLLALSVYSTARIASPPANSGQD